MPAESLRQSLLHGNKELSKRARSSNSKRMRESLSRMVVCLGVLACFAGCASTGQQQVNPQITSALSASGVTGSTYNKVASGQKLAYNDILTLVSKGVPAHVVESYLQSTGAVYQLSSSQISTLQNAGAAPQLVNYLQETGGFYAHQPASGQGGSSSTGPNPQYVNSPLYQDEQPFAYNAPEVDYWYNSSYEESMYSPFSFDGG